MSSCCFKLDYDAICINVYTLDAADFGSDKPERKDDGLVVPILRRNQPPGIDNCATEEEKLRLDLSLRPDDMTQEAYDALPVESFGLAMLRGMGYQEGVAIGNRKRGLLKPIELTSRHYRLGLGAKPLEDVLPPTHGKGQTLKQGAPHR